MNTIDEKTNILDEITKLHREYELLHNKLLMLLEAEIKAKTEQHEANT